MEDQKKDRARPMEITVKAVVIGEDGRVLLVKRADDDYTNAGKWDIPGGLLEFNETVEEVLKREVLEETGLEVEVGPVIRVCEFFKDSELFRKEKRSLRYIAYCQGDADVKLSEEHSEFLWLKMDEAIEKFNEKDGFENDKKNTLLDAKKYLEMQKAQDGMKRLAADFENYKKRQAQVQKEWAQFSNENMIMQILPVLDNFHASTDHIPEDQKENPWVVGIMHIQEQLEKILEDNGVSEIKVKEGDGFNPEIMEAVESKESEEGESRNAVSKIVQKGYKIGDKIIRATRVIVE
jgi:molecular chaperone GrpE (heat shock protein)